VTPGAVLHPAAGQYPPPCYFRAIRRFVNPFCGFGDEKFAPEIPVNTTDISRKESNENIYRKNAG